MVTKYHPHWINWSWSIPTTGPPVLFVVTGLCSIRSAEHEGGYRRFGRHEVIFAESGEFWHSAHKQSRSVVKQAACPAALPRLRWKFAQLRHHRHAPGMARHVRLVPINVVPQRRDACRELLTRTSDSFSWPVAGTPCERCRDSQRDSASGRASAVTAPEGRQV